MKPQPAKLTTACTNCRRTKRRCSGIIPCSRCSARSLECVILPYADKRRHRPRRAATSSTGPAALSVSDSATTPRQVIKVARELPGSLIFQLRMSQDGQFDYRGPPASIIGDSIPSHRHHYQHESIEWDDDPVANHHTGPGCPNLTVWPSREELEMQIDIFLEWQNLSMVVIHSSTLQGLMRDYPPQATESPEGLLVCAILSLTYSMQGGAGKAHLGRRSMRQAGEVMFQTAKAALFQMATTGPRVEVVQAACVLACRQFSHGRENEAWVLHGVGATVATAIGLHVGGDHPRWIRSGYLSTDAAEVRTTTSWTHVLMDRYLTMSLGRPSLLQLSSYSTPNVQLRLPKAPFHHQRRPVQGTLEMDSKNYENSVLNTLHYSISLWGIGDESIRSVYQWSYSLLKPDTAHVARTCHNLPELAQQRDAAFARWVEQLPATLRITETGPLPHLLVLHMACNNLRIHLQRPLLSFFPQDPGRPRSSDNSQDQGRLGADTYSIVTACATFAHEITSLAETFQKHYSMRCSTFMLAHYLLTASTIHILDIERATRDEDTTGMDLANQALETCLEILQDMADTWEIAWRAIAVIKRLRSRREGTRKKATAPPMDKEEEEEEEDVRIEQDDVNDNEHSSSNEDDHVLEETAGHPDFGDNYRSSMSPISLSPDIALAGGQATSSLEGLEGLDLTIKQGPRLDIFGGWDFGSISP